MGDDPMDEDAVDGRPLACPEWRDDLAGWLVAQLPPDREAALAAHLDGCDVCRTEAESLLAVAAVSLATTADEPAAGGLEPPPHHLGERIAASVAAERRHRGRLRAGFVVLAGAAAAVVAVVALGSGGGGPEPLEGEEVAFAVVPPGGQAAAVLAADKGGGTVVELTATGLDPDVTYALWLTPPGGGWDDRVASGTFRPDDDGTVDTRLRCALPVDQYGRAWATTPDGKIALDTKTS